MQRMCENDGVCNWQIMPALKQTKFEMEKYMLSSDRITYCFERIRNTLAFSSKTEAATKDWHSGKLIIIMTNHQ